MLTYSIHIETIGFILNKRHMTEFNLEPKEKDIKTQILVPATMGRLLTKLARKSQKSAFVIDCIEKSGLYKQHLKKEKDADE